MKTTLLILAGLLLMIDIAVAEEKPSFALVLHGGAGKDPAKMPADEVRAVEASLEKALDVGLAALRTGGDSLTAVEKVIRFLEDDPLFNAGRGAVFNSEGKHELDASIMNGRTLGCGAVAAVRTVKNPISLARLVMEKTPHVLLAGDGAEQFADELNIERVENSWFSTDKARQEWEAKRRADPAGKQAASTSEDPHYGTVGCVALDAHGNLAAGTSTGGRTNKKFGRIGDSPIIGAGTYANNQSCGVSCTGIGEEFIRHSVASDVSARMLYLKQSLPEAVSHILTKTLPPDAGGIIAIDRAGKIVMEFSTPGMARAAASGNGYREVKIGR
ncbi:MAG: isoaspartyl peptidase/L-asparaginase [Pirellulaceae bacterium]|nr:isoaspartyl peptidase/L-asparaginase [Pirellulaceae bacterium]